MTHRQRAKRDFKRNFPRMVRVDFSRRAINRRARRERKAAR